MSFTAYGTATALAIQTQTATAGYALVNGTGNVLTWTTPNDGQNHRALINSLLNVSSTETGGQISYTFTPPGGSSTTKQLIAAGNAGGVFPTAPLMLICQPNTAVIVLQNSALTGGAATMWAEIWGS